jgi:hypothetical protein
MQAAPEQLQNDERKRDKSIGLAIFIAAIFLSLWIRLALSTLRNRRALWRNLADRI